MHSIGRKGRFIDLVYTERESEEENASAFPILRRVATPAIRSTGNETLGAPSFLRLCFRG